jgi:CcmD family protein
MRIRTITRLAAVAAAALTLSLTPAPRLAAQDSVATAPAASTVPAAASPEQSLRRTVLPGEDIEHQPRTMRAYWHVFAAFTLAWLLVFGYAISLGRRFRSLEREVDALRGTS